MKEVTSHTYDSFEHGIWIVEHPGITLTICGIHRLPPSAQNKLTINQFLDEFMEFTADVITQHTNPIFIGDLNVHANDLNNPDTEIFIDTMSALGLDQHIDFPTHKVATHWTYSSLNALVELRLVSAVQVNTSLIT